MVPESVSVPAATVKPPAPLIAPEKVPAAALSVRPLLAAVTTLPAPDKVVIVAPLVVPDTFNVPLATTPLDVAIEPLPLYARVAGLLMVVVPV